MKILHVEVNAILSEGAHENIKKRVNDDIKNGILITDNFINVKVIEFDEFKICKTEPKKKIYSATYTCLDCEHEETVRHERKTDFREIDLCPKCNGLIVDKWSYPKYEHLNKRIGGD